MVNVCNKYSSASCKTKKLKLPKTDIKRINYTITRNMDQEFFKKSKIKRRQEIKNNKKNIKQFL